MIVPCCWVDPVTNKTVCGFCDSETGKIVADPNAGKPADLTPHTAAKAVSTVTEIASYLPMVGTYLQGLQALVALGIEIAPTIKGLFGGKEVTVEEQAKVAAFIESIENGTACAGDEWKQD